MWAAGIYVLQNERTHPSTYICTSIESFFQTSTIQDCCYVLARQPGLPIM